VLDLRPLRAVSFRHLAAAGWVNEFGNWIGEITLAILVFDRTRSPLATAGLFLAMRFLPAVLAPFLAVRIETLQPRFVLATIYVIEAGIFMALAAATRHFSLPLLLALAASDGVLSITSSALSRSTLATALAEHGLLREGIALINFGGMIVIAGAPALAGLMVASHGTATALRIDAATFVVAALIIVAGRDLRLASDEDKGFRERVRAGLDTLRGRPSVSRLLIAISLVIALGSVALPVEVVFAKQVLHAGDSGYGLLLTAWGAGMIVGAFAFTVLRQVRLTTMLAIGTSLIVVGYCGLAAAPTLLVACAFSAVGGAGNSAAWVAAGTALQERTPLNRQAAVMAVLEAFNQVMPALGFIVGGAVTALTSARIAYAISAAGIAAVIVWFSFRPIDRVPLEDTEDRDNGVDGSAIATRMHENGSPPRTPSKPPFTIA
jgi:predicted MFS family arabinose efflux permease